MKNFRIAVVEYEHPTAGMKKTFALQRRIGVFFWYTVARCNREAECFCVYKSIIGRKKERFINVLRYI